MHGPFWEEIYSIGSGGSRIFLRGAQTPKVGVLTYFLVENCMKMKEFGLPEGRVPGTPPLDLPLIGYNLKRILDFLDGGANSGTVVGGWGIQT